MGKSIVYCSDCGNGLREDDFTRGKAGLLDQRPYCIQCRPEAAGATPRPSRAATDRVPLATPQRHGSTRRIFRPSHKSPLALWAGLGAAGVLILLVLGLGRPDKRPPSPPALTNATEPPVRTAPPPPPKAPEAPILVQADPEAQLNRSLEDIDKLILKDKDQSRTAEIRAMLDKAASLAGPRRADVERRRAAYEQSLLKPVPAPEPPRPAASGPTVTGFTLINADTDKPVSGFDPIPEGALIELAKIGTRNIDFRANTAPSRVPGVKLTLDKEAPHLERGWPYALSGNDGAEKYQGFTPSSGAHTLVATLWPNKDFKGPPGHSLTLRFTIR